MTKKLSEETVYPQKSIGDELNYEHDYVYASGFAHRLDHISDRYYRYDLNGNVTAEQFGAFSDDDGASGNGSGSGGTSSGSGSDDDDGWDCDDDWQGGSGIIYSDGTTAQLPGSGSSSSGSNAGATNNDDDDGWDDSEDGQ